MRTIVFLDKNNADELASIGFKYIETKLSDGKSVYIFVENDDIQKICKCNFTNKDYFIGDHLFL